MEEAKRRKEELLALRSQDKKATKRVQTMLRSTKSANKSVMEDAVDNVNTADTLNGLLLILLINMNLIIGARHQKYSLSSESSHTPFFIVKVSFGMFLGFFGDEDDYGYVSQEAAALYNKLLNKYENMPPEPPKFEPAKKEVKDLKAAKVSGICTWN